MTHSHLECLLRGLSAVDAFKCAPSSGPLTTRSSSQAMALPRASLLFVSTEPRWLSSKVTQFRSSVQPRAQMGFLQLWRCFDMDPEQGRKWEISAAKAASSTKSSVDNQFITSVFWILKNSSNKKNILSCLPLKKNKLIK